MGLESASFVNDLNTSNPTATDPKAQGDDHLRLIKTALKASFPNSSRAFYIPSSVAAETSTVNVAAADQGKVYPVNATGGAITVNLPASSGIPDGYEVTVFKSDSSSNTVTIDGASSETINGATTYALTKQFQGIRLIWLDTFNQWVGLPWINAIPYFAGGQDIALTDIAPSGNAKRVLAATTATDWSEHTAEAILEFIGTPARGNLLMRGASAFAQFVPGTAGYFLKSAGAGSDLVWASPASALPARAYAELTAYTTVTGNIPYDNSIPQNTEGDEILTCAITMNSASSRARVTAVVPVSSETDDRTLTLALFRDSVANALAVSWHRQSADAGGQNKELPLTIVFEELPGSASVTYKLRAGQDTSGSMYINGDDNSRLFGGASRATLVVEEIPV